MCDSKNYYWQNEIYEIFSQAEDYPWYILNYLKKIVKNKRILDIWCWTGKYIDLLNSYYNHIIWVDASKYQLEITKQKTINKQNISLIQADAINIPLENHFVDITLGCWFLGTIESYEKKKIILNELKRVLKIWGKIIFVENWINWEFQQIRKKNLLNPNPVLIYNNWLISEWFKVVKTIKSYFKFQSLQQANHIFQSIRWDNINKDLIKDSIWHEIDIFEYLNK